MMTTNVPQDERGHVIRASDVGTYTYCAHAWWLESVEGVRFDHARHLQVGRAAHERHGRRVVLSAALTRLSYLLLILAGLTGLGWLVSLWAG